MNALCLAGMTAVAALAIPGDGSSVAAGPPVLRKLEPEDSGVFLLPGPAPARPRITRVIRMAPAPVPSPLPVRLNLTTPPLPSVPTPIPVAVVETAPPPPLPEAMQQEVAFYCQKYIGRWRQPDARLLLGAPLRSRAAYDELKAANGRIYAFRDPTSRYKEVELDFDGKTGYLRTVFVYPQRLTWPEARRRWTGEVNAADARQGRKFYSYANRRLDVLVDAGGKVISLGLY
jgi:hypothetical protein